MDPSPANGEKEQTDPEILALLDFVPVPRAYKQRGSWTPELQRLLIERIAVTGSVRKACDQLGKDRGGALRVYKAAGADSFRLSWDGALALWERRNGLAPPEPFVGEVPGGGRRKCPLPGPLPPAGEGEDVASPSPRRLINEYGEVEDEDAFHRRAEDARDSISAKLRRAPRLFLHDISDCPAKRAAFEILTELPVDWTLAAQCRPQADEP